MAEKNTHKKIKVLFIIDMLVGFAGTEKHLFDIISNLNRELFSCYVIAFKTRKWVEDEFKKYGVTFLTIPLERIYGLHALKQFCALVSYLRKIGPNIVQTFHFKADTFGVLASRIAGTSCIISSRRDIGDLKKKSHILLNRLMNRWVNKFIANCEAVAKTLQNNEHVALKKIYVIYNGLDIQKYHLNPHEISKIRESLNISSDAFVVGVVSNFRPEKDIPVFFKSMFILMKKIKNLKIIAAGCGVSEIQRGIGEQLVQFCRENNLLSHTLFPGYVRDVRPYIAAMDIACLTPIQNEGFSNSILEKMSMGKPVVATDVGGNSEAVIDGETGFIVSPSNPQQIADKILYLYRNKNQRELMGEKGRQRVQTNFSLEKMITAIESFYLNMLDQGERLQ